MSKRRARQSHGVLAASAPMAAVGIDVSKDELVVAAQRRAGVEEARFANTAAGHRALIVWLRRGRGAVRIALEATGIYSLDVALALHAAGFAVMVVNPRAARDFARALLQRTTTDPIAAATLREFAARMPFVAWQPPVPAMLELRTVARRIAALVAERAAEKNRLHALRATATTPAVVVRDVTGNIRALTRRAAQLLRAAKALIAATPVLQRPYAQLRSMPGVGPASAVQLLGELLVLPADMSAKQWVAHAGLDPRWQESGSSVRTLARISKQGNSRLRAGLFMPALTARRCQPNVRAFGDTLAARQKKPLQVLTAIMRKLLHAIHGMFRTNTTFQPEKFYRLLAQAA
jgi:transposase